MKMFSYKRFLIFFISMIALVGSITFTLINVNRLQESSKEVNEAYQVINLLESIVLNVSESESMGLGYLLSNDLSFLEKYKNTKQFIDGDLDKISNTYSYIFDHSQEVILLKRLIGKRVFIMDKSIDLKKEQKLSQRELLSKFNIGRYYLEKIKVQKDKMVVDEQFILFHKQEKLASSIMNTVLIIITCLIVVLAWGVYQAIYFDRYLKSQKKLESDLIKLNENKNRFFSIISHDLRAPVNNILQLTELIKEEVQEGEKSKLNEMIELSIKKVSNLLNDLLEWSRAQMNIIKMESKFINLQKLVEENFLLLNETAKVKNIKLINDVKNDETIWADEEMIKTVLRNLISNSLKFTKEGGEIIVSAESKGNFTDVLVKDNGIGMSEEFMSKLFRTDVKVSELGTAKESGSGLGLQISKEFVEKNGGTISVNSEVNKGTIFKFSLLTKEPSRNINKDRKPVKKELKRMEFKKRERKE